MSSCVIAGGSGFIGTHLARRLRETRRFDTIVLADIRPSPLAGQPGIETLAVDVREPLPAQLDAYRPEWIFNLAAVHREPGHAPHEYYLTNILGARHVCAYASRTGCDRLLFTSSISVYGPTDGPTTEDATLRPSTPYGGSKLAAEALHEQWLDAEPHRRLIIVRPGVIYGPGDPGNILRMIRAIRAGLFVTPGTSGLRKSYGYIYGLLDALLAAMAWSDRRVIFNYVDYPTAPLATIAEDARRFVGAKWPVWRVPVSPLVALASAVNAITGGHSEIHPLRVRKAATSTYIVPQVLRDRGWKFKYDFPTSLAHWRGLAPEDFERSKPSRQEGR
jgi:nucleoside-diphosphate-sugar epimerase